MSGFIYGAATSSYQIEGAAEAEGRSPSIWDIFDHIPGKVQNGDTGVVACDHYHRYEGDVRLMKELGLGAYRFSVAWPRVFPLGRGALNRAGLDFYQRLVDLLLENGIQPFITLYHWDLPQALEDRGGWRNRDTALAFADYARAVGEALGDRVEYWSTLNEPWCSAFLGHFTGEHAPGLHDLGAALSVAHHLLLAHALGALALREMGVRKVGTVLNFTPVYPYKNSLQDRAATERAQAFYNDWFLMPLVQGRYPAYPFTEQAVIPVQEGDLEMIKGSLDFLGVNYYSRALVGAGTDFLSATHHMGPGPVTEMGWEIYPQGLYDLLMWLKQDAGGLPLYVTENGAAFADQLQNGQVDDPRRITYLEQHLEAVHKARKAGAPVQGYFAWSLMDNFEWAYGYSKRFGLVYVDYTTQRRIPKASAYWYADYIKQAAAG